MSDSSHRSWYFVNTNGLVLGPFDEVKLTEKLSKKELTPESLVWNGTAASKWTRLCNVPNLLPRLQRKSRGFSQLEDKLKKIADKAIKKIAYGVHLSPQVSPSSMTSQGCDIFDVLTLGDMADDENEEEKCPVLSPRPLLSALKSERSVDSTGSSASLQCLPGLVSSPSAGCSADSKKGFKSFRTPLMDHSSEEPLCLDDGLPDEFHFLKPGYACGMIDDDIDNKVDSDGDYDETNDYYCYTDLTSPAKQLGGSAMIRDSFGLVCFEKKKIEQPKKHGLYGMCDFSLKESEVKLLQSAEYFSYDSDSSSSASLVVSDGTMVYDSPELDADSHSSPIPKTWSFEDCI